MTRDNESLIILVVGNIEHWHASGRELPRIAQIEFCAFSDMTQNLLSRLQPEIILTPLLCEGFDVLDLVYLLEALNFTGRVRAITPMLPNPELLLREIRFECPALDFDLFQVRPGPKPRIM